MRSLNVWRDDEHVGVFSDNDGTVIFSYDSPQTAPISLSLPNGGDIENDAPGNFLENLLPENGNARLAMQTALDAESSDTFELLDSLDTAGGLVFTSSDEQPELPSQDLAVMTYDDMVAQSHSVSKGSSSWWLADKRIRYSLAGAQGKFTASYLDGRWFWPSATTPSTHIFKPEASSVPHAAELENAGIRLASACGLDAPDSEVVDLDGHNVFVICRFDREYKDDGLVKRLHTEDLCQALGLKSQDKYEMEVATVIKKLRDGGVSEQNLNMLFHQIVFNTLVGNSDAHLKNYSLFVMPEGESLCPIYDAVPTAFWPEFDSSLGMSVNDLWNACELSIYDWKAEAYSAGLDPDKAEETVMKTAISIVAGLPIITKGFDARSRERLYDIVKDSCSGIWHVLPDGVNELWSENRNRVESVQQAYRQDADRKTIPKPPIPETRNTVSLFHNPKGLTR